MLADFHAHSQYSFDSDSSIESYLDADNRLLVTTEHLELHNSAHNNMDDIPDFVQINRNMAAIEEESRQSLTTVVGAEVGYSREHFQQLEDILASQPIALRLLSFHAYRDHDYIETEAHRDLSDSDYAYAYFDMVLEGVEKLGSQVQVLAHLDYPLRYRESLASDALFDQYQPQIEAILLACARQGIVIEMNTKSMVKYGRECLYNRLAELVAHLNSPEHPLEVCLGSDCHRAQDWHAHFEQALAMVNAHGLKPISVEGMLERRMV
ncbi:histidinol-phosphatase [Bombiscardovia apis]|uniref:Histidinol-phosphatase n=1 Tax=Bombiscardovia apis TaxID=2932182 RepID=A0ABN6SHM9_9BIFI|nr:PHP domain-containing protein [Bombiscardovia apis]BDR54085.1 histidinol-phosphatase [Bombiscardovia apis]